MCPALEGVVADGLVVHLRCAKHFCFKAFVPPSLPPPPPLLHDAPGGGKVDADRTDRRRAFQLAAKCSPRLTTPLCPMQRRAQALEDSLGLSRLRFLLLHGDSDGHDGHDAIAGSAGDVVASVSRSQYDKALSRACRVLEAASGADGGAAVIAAVCGELEDEGLGLEAAALRDAVPTLGSALAGAAPLSQHRIARQERLVRDVVPRVREMAGEAAAGQGWRQEVPGESTGCGWNRIRALPRHCA